MSDFECLKGEFEDSGDWISDRIMSSVLIDGRRLRNVYFDSPVIADIMSQAKGDIVVGYTVWNYSTFFANYMENLSARNESRLETRLRHMKDGSQELLKDGRCNIFYIKDLQQTNDEFIVKKFIPTKKGITFSFVDGPVFNAIIFIWIAFCGITLIAFHFWSLFLFIVLYPIFWVYRNHLSQEARSYKEQIINQLRSK
jgi:hypothetical protein